MTRRALSLLAMVLAVAALLLLASCTDPADSTADETPAAAATQEAPASATAQPTATQEPTASATIQPTATPEPSVTATPSPAPTMAATPTPTATPTAKVITPSATATPAATPTATPSPTASEMVAECLDAQQLVREYFEVYGASVDFQDADCSWMMGGRVAEYTRIDGDGTLAYAIWHIWFDNSRHGPDACRVWFVEGRALPHLPSLGDARLVSCNSVSGAP